MKMKPLQGMQLHIPGVIGYAALLAIVGVLLHFGVGPKDLETTALVGILAAAVPSMAVKPAAPATSPDDGATTKEPS